MLFESGNIVMTKAVSETISKDDDFFTFCMSSLNKHLIGEWGDADESTKIENDIALKEGERLMSVYVNDDPNKTIWIITEADRSATTILFPSDY